MRRKDRDSSDSIRSCDNFPCHAAPGNFPGRRGDYLLLLTFGNYLYRLATLKIGLATFRGGLPEIYRLATKFTGWQNVPGVGNRPRGVAPKAL